MLKHGYRLILSGTWGSWKISAPLHLSQWVKYSWNALMDRLVRCSITDLASTLTKMRLEMAALLIHKIKTKSVALLSIRRISRDNLNLNVSIKIHAPLISWMRIPRFLRAWFQIRSRSRPHQKENVSTTNHRYSFSTHAKNLKSFPT